jgi:DNA polymerase delta subunit 2
MLEDESGRIKLVGDCIISAKLVTGVVIGALGAETPNGEFEVVDICYAGMASQVQPDDNVNMAFDGLFFSAQCPPSHLISYSAKAPTTSFSSTSDEWISLISGLDIGASSPSDAQIQLLVEYLTGEGGGTEDQSFVSQISRLIIAGNSLAPPIITDVPEDDKKQVSEHLFLQSKPKKLITFSSATIWI